MKACFLPNAILTRTVCWYIMNVLLTNSMSQLDALSSNLVLWCCVYIPSTNELHGKLETANISQGIKAG